MVSWYVIVGCIFPDRNDWCWSLNRCPIWPFQWHTSLLCSLIHIQEGSWVSRLGCRTSIQELWLLLPTSATLTCCVTLVKSCNLPVPRFPYLYKATSQGFVRLSSMLCDPQRKDAMKSVKDSLYAPDRYCVGRKLASHGYFVSLHPAFFFSSYSTKPNCSRAWNVQHLVHQSTAVTRDWWEP